MKSASKPTKQMEMGEEDGDDENGVEDGHEDGEDEEEGGLKLNKKPS